MSLGFNRRPSGRRGKCFVLDTPVFGQIPVNGGYSVLLQDCDEWRDFLGRLVKTRTNSMPRQRSVLVGASGRSSILYHFVLIYHVH